MKLFFSQYYTFICSFVVGILFGVSWKLYRESTINRNYVQPMQNQRLRFQKTKILEDEKVIFLNKVLPNANVSCHLDQVNVLCLIFVKTSKSTKAIKSTWSKRCSYTLFYGTFKDDSIPIINYKPSYSSKYFCNILFTIWDRHKDKADWLFIAKDDIFAIINSLKYYVCTLDPHQFYYLGRPIKMYQKPFYNVLDSGIVLSKGAIEILIKSLINSSFCGNLTHPLIGPLHKKFDITIAIILKAHNVFPFDTRDTQLRARFLAYLPQDHILPNKISYYNPFWRNNLLIQLANFTLSHECTFISFHSFLNQ